MTMTRARYECPECDLVCVGHDDGSWTCLECGVEWDSEASIASGAIGIRWRPRAWVMTPDGPQRLYTWHPSPSAPFVTTMEPLDDGVRERMRTWHRSQLSGIAEPD